MGINFSRLLTLKYGTAISNYLHTKYTVISVGRVMTCVLGMVVRREREIREFCLPDASEDLFLRLGIDPAPAAFLALHPRHLLHQAVDIFSFPSGVRTYIDPLHIFPVQESCNDAKLFGNRRDHLILKGPRRII